MRFVQFFLFISMIYYIFQWFIFINVVQKATSHTKATTPPFYNCKGGSGGCPTTKMGFLIIKIAACTGQHIRMDLCTFSR